MKQMPQIQKFMTTLPHTIGRDIPLKTAGIFTAVDALRVLGETLGSFYKPGSEKMMGSWA